MEKYRNRGGIRSISKAWEQEDQKASLEDEDEKTSEKTSAGDSGPESARLFPHGSTAKPPPLPVVPPGRAFFTRPPSLIEELYPPGLSREGASSSLEQSLLQVDVQETIREVVCGGWLATCYETQPVPTDVWQWLFQIMCRTPERQLSDAALRSLLELQGIALRRGQADSLHPPMIHDVVDMLLSLGAEESCVHRGGDEVAMEMDERDDVFVPDGPPLSNLANMLRYLVACLRALPHRFTVSDAEKLVHLLLGLALDPRLSVGVLNCDVSHCITTTFSVIPDDNWVGFVSSIVSDALSLSSHHHNRLHLAFAIGGVSKRSREVQRRFCRGSMEEVLSSSSGEGGEGDSEGSGDGPPRQLQSTDCFLAQRILRHYCTLPSDSIDYYEMHSTLTMVLLLVDPAGVKWPSCKAKEEFEKTLATLKSRIRDRDPSHRERIPVKDLLIRMKLLTGRSKVAASNLKQTSLFD